MPDNTRPLPTTTVSGGSLLRPLDSPPREGEQLAAEEASRWPLVFRVESGKGRRGDQLVRLDPSAER